MLQYVKWSEHLLQYVEHVTNSSHWKLLKVEVSDKFGGGGVDEWPAWVARLDTCGRCLGLWAFYVDVAWTWKSALGWRTESGPVRGIKTDEEIRDNKIKINTDVKRPTKWHWQDRKDYDRLEYEDKQLWIAGNMLFVAGWTSKDVVYNCTIEGVGN